MFPDTKFLWILSNWNRYRLILTVSDNTDTAAFLAFDMEMVKLTNIQPSEAAQIVVCPKIHH